ncbi:MAG: pseudouridine synthase [Colwellia sp.]
MRDEIEQSAVNQGNKEISKDVNKESGASLVKPTFQEKPVLRILLQDEYLVAVDKPAGLFVHKSFMDKHEIYFALQLVRDQIGQYVYPIHRLDKPTSGVLLFALNKDVARLMSEYFSQKSDSIDEITQFNQLQEADNPKLIKTYYALVRGYLGDNTLPSKPQLINYSLKEKLDKIGDKYAKQDKPAQSAITQYQVLKQASLNVPLGKYDSVRYSLVKLTPITGRRHQLRRHLAHLRHPIIGDINYGDNKQNPFFIQHFGFKRLMLIAKNLSFIHPITKQWISVEAEFDEQWQKTFEVLNWD